ncbi:EF-hand domain-containing protein [Erythrobacter sp. MTPC3]|uniref:EF-hand domain-containing protein n=1 Tax=Erythrobacter sp. MTPC3 TaxID=3056564 RepID=UPI0036F2BB2C
MAAQDREARASQYDPAILLLANVRSGSTSHAYLNNLLSAFRAVDGDSNGLDRDDVARIDARVREESLAKLQSRIARSESEIAEMDADGDGGLTEAEIRDAIEYQRSGRKVAEGIFDIYDFDKDGLIEIADIARGNGRQLRILNESDLNGDKRLSKEEYLAAFAKLRPATTEEPNIRFDQMDLDGNGIVTAAEMAGQAVPFELSTREQERRSRMFERLFQIDQDGDARLSEEELTGAFRRQFARIDSDGDGTVSPAEYRAGRRTVELARDIASLPLCAVPTPEAGTELLAIAARGGQLGSTVAVGGQDRETSIAEVIVEPGDAPLFVLLMAEEPVIWEFSGATERVSQVVALSGRRDDAGNALAGTIGVSQGKVRFGDDCFPVRKALGASNYGTAQLETVIAAVTGLETRAGAERIGRVFLPSLGIERFNTGVPAPEGFDPDVWWMVTDERPRGIRDLDPSRVVAATSVERYDILPAEFGLARLTYQGTIEPTEHDNEFRLLKPLERFPGALTGASSVSFMLGEGLARPQGEFGRGCLYAADGETVLEGDYCRRYPRGNAVQIRIGQDGKSCLYRYGGEKAGCFPEDGGPLRAVETDEGIQFKSVPFEERGDEMQTQVRPAPPSDYLSPIEIIPAGLRHRW